MPQTGRDSSAVSLPAQPSQQFFAQTLLLVVSICALAAEARNGQDEEEDADHTEKGTPEGVAAGNECDAAPSKARATHRVAKGTAMTFVH